MTDLAAEMARIRDLLNQDVPEAPPEEAEQPEPSVEPQATPRKRFWVPEAVLRTISRRFDVTAFAARHPGQLVESRDLGRTTARLIARRIAEGFDMFEFVRPQHKDLYGHLHRNIAKAVREANENQPIHEAAEGHTNWLLDATERMRSGCKAGDSCAEMINSLAREWESQEGDVEAFEMARDALTKRAWEFGLIDAPSTAASTTSPMMRYGGYGVYGPYGIGGYYGWGGHHHHDEDDEEVDDPDAEEVTGEDPYEIPYDDEEEETYDEYADAYGDFGGDFGESKKDGRKPVTEAPNDPAPLRPQDQPGAMRGKADVVGTPRTQQGDQGTAGAAPGGSSGFQKAFADARKKGLLVFDFGGKKFTTKRAGESDEFHKAKMKFIAGSEQLAPQELKALLAYPKGLGPDEKKRLEQMAQTGQPAAASGPGQAAAAPGQPAAAGAPGQPAAAQPGVQVPPHDQLISRLDKMTPQEKKAIFDRMRANRMVPESRNFKSKLIMEALSDEQLEQILRNPNDPRYKDLAGSFGRTAQEIAKSTPTAAAQTKGDPEQVKKFRVLAQQKKMVGDDEEANVYTQIADEIERGADVKKLMQRVVSKGGDGWGNWLYSIWDTESDQIAKQAKAFAAAGPAFGKLQDDEGAIIDLLTSWYNTRKLPKGQNNTELMKGYQKDLMQRLPANEKELLSNEEGLQKLMIQYGVIKQ